MGLISEVMANPMDVFSDTERYRNDQEAIEYFLKTASQDIVLARRSIDAKFLSELCLDEEVQKTFLMSLAKLKDSEIERRINSCELLKNFTARHAILHLFITLPDNVASLTRHSAPNSAKRSSTRPDFFQEDSRRRSYSQHELYERDYLFAVYRMKSSLVMLVDHVFRPQLRKKPEYEERIQASMTAINLLTKATHRDKSKRPTPLEVISTLKDTRLKKYTKAYYSLLKKCEAIQKEADIISAKLLKLSSCPKANAQDTAKYEEYNNFKESIETTLDSCRGAELQNRAPDIMLRSEWSTLCHTFDKVIGLSQASFLTKHKEFGTLRGLLTEANSFVSFCNLLATLGTAPANNVSFIEQSSIESAQKSPQTSAATTLKEEQMLSDDAASKSASYAESLMLLSPVISVTVLNEEEMYENNDDDVQLPTSDGENIKPALLQKQS